MSYPQPPIDQRYAPPPRQYSNGSAQVSVKSITIPAVLGASALFAAVIGTYAFTSEFKNLQAAINRMSDELRLMTRGVEGRLDRVESELDRRTSDRYTRTDHDLWCERTERLNEALGWRCATSPPTAPARHFFNDSRRVTQ